MKLRTVTTGTASPAACLAGIGYRALGATRQAIFGLRKKPGLRKTLITAVMSLALVAGGTAAGAAIASGPVDSSGVIHGCYGQTNADGTTHDVVLQNAGTTCPSNMTPITWNQTGPQGQAGPAGSTGPAGPAGPAGAVGPAGPAGADGKTVLNGTGAPAASVGSDGDFYIDTAADVLFGPKAGGAWPASGASLVGQAGLQGPPGPQGPAGATGSQGPPGTAMKCQYPGSTGATGTVAVASVAADGTVTLTCSVPADECIHSTGLPGLDGNLVSYTDCTNAPGTPGDPTTYSQVMAANAESAYDYAILSGTNALAGPGQVENCDGPNALAVLSLPQDGSGQTFTITWAFGGPNAGHVVEVPGIAAKCPTSSDPVWS